MRNHLSILIGSERSRANLHKKELIERLGYKNKTKGLRRLEALERDGTGPLEFFHAVVRELSISQEKLQEAQRKDTEEEARAVEESAAQPQPIQFIVKGPIPVQMVLPPTCNTEKLAIQHVQSYVEARKIKACLVLDRRRSLWFEPGGIMFQTTATSTRPNLPSIEIP
jgi:hypothetical protein